jgi:antitoxin ParD1/3/4
MATIDVSLPDDLRTYLDARAAAEGTSPADYVIRLVERDLSIGRAALARDRAAWDEGVRSPVLDDEPEDILEQIIAEIPARDVAA